MNDNIEFEKHFFRPVCNEQEIERIFNVKNANDYLLKLRAETIVDHMRLFRDRDRGSGCPPAPPTPPCVRVRTRRFGGFS
jgi:hypothetical protein